MEFFLFILIFYFMYKSKFQDLNNIHPDFHLINCGSQVGGGEKIFQFVVFPAFYEIQEIGSAKVDGGLAACRNLREKLFAVFGKKKKSLRRHVDGVTSNWLYGILFPLRFSLLAHQLFSLIFLIFSLIFLIFSEKIIMFLVCFLEQEV